MLDLFVATKEIYCHLGTEMQSLCFPDYITMAIVHGIDLRGIVGIKMINVFLIVKYLGYPILEVYWKIMMTPGQGNSFHITVSLWGKVTSHWWIPLTKGQ